MLHLSLGEQIGSEPTLPYLSPELKDERLLVGANFASAGIGILNDTGIQFVRRRTIFNLLLFYIHKFFVIIVNVIVTIVVHIMYYYYYCGYDYYNYFLFRVRKSASIYLTFETRITYVELYSFKM